MTWKSNHFRNSAGHTLEMNIYDRKKKIPKEKEHKICLNK